MRVLLALPLLLILVVFALSNPQPVRLGLWPTDFSIEAPLSLAVLLAMAAAFLLGAFLLWVSALAARARARRAERAADRLEQELNALRAATAATPSRAPDRAPDRALAPVHDL